MRPFVVGLFALIAAALVGVVCYLMFESAFAGLVGLLVGLVVVAAVYQVSRDMS